MRNIHTHTEFCLKYYLPDFSLDSHILSLFIQYSLDTGCKMSSVRNMLSSIRTIAIIMDFPVMQRKFPEVSLTLRGIAKLLKCAIKRTFPITPSIMLSIHDNFNLAFSTHNIICALFLIVYFFLMLRKSILKPSCRKEVNFPIYERLCLRL